MPALPAEPRILVTRTDRIGDLVISSSVFSEIRKRYPKAWIGALVFQENRELIEGNPFIDELILYDKKGREKGWGGNLCFARRLKRSRYDVVVHLHATNRMHWVGMLAGIPVRIGWARKCAWALTRRLPDYKREGKRHEASYNFDLLKGLDIPEPAEYRMHVPVRDDAARSLDELLFQLDLNKERPWVALHASASCPSKRWPLERFAELAARLKQSAGVAVCLIGGPEDEALGRRIERQSGSAVVNLCGRLNLSMLAIFLKRCRLLISNDTGPVHVAAAVNTPVISVFGRNDPGLSPQRWKPLAANSRVLWKDIDCNPCLAHRCQINFLCLDVISVDDVLRKIRELDPGLANTADAQKEPRR